MLQKTGAAFYSPSEVTAKWPIEAPTLMSTDEVAKHFPADDTPPSAEPPVPPVEEHERPRKPGSRLNYERIREDGKVAQCRVTAKPGYTIDEVLLTEFDPTTKKMKVGIITRARRGRPSKAQAA